MNLEGIARLCHEVNRAYCNAIGETPAHKPWEDAPQWQRDSAVNGVRAHLRNPEMTPEQSHDSWMAEKGAAGWTYGPVKNEQVKTHPCMLPYCDLPEEQRVKDHLFRAVVHACLAELS